MLTVEAMFLNVMTRLIVQHQVKHSRLCVFMQTSVCVTLKEQLHSLVCGFFGLHKNQN